MANIRNEYRTIHPGAGWAERDGRGRLRLSGVDVGTFLQALVSNDVSRLEPRQGVHATYLTPNGRMLADFEIHRRPDRWVVGLAATRAQPMADRLDQSIFSEDVQIADVTSSTAEIVVVGLSASIVAGRALSIDSDALDALNELGQVDWKDGFVARIGDALLPMFTIVAGADRRDEVVSRLADAGAVQVSPELLEALRIEAGRPRFGVDMTEDTIPLEAGLLDRAISTSKGCYVGQEIVIRILHRGGGRVAKRLVTLSIDASDGDALRPGTSLVDDGTHVGSVTSVAESPSSAGLLALGYVQRDRAEVGRTLAAGESGARVPVTITGFAR